MQKVNESDRRLRPRLRPRRVRCAVCRKKLPIIGAVSLCRCGGNYCGSHMSDHTCTYIPSPVSSAAPTAVIPVKVIQI